MLGDDPVNIERGTAYTDAGATAFDAGDNAGKAVTTTGTVDTSVEGVHFPSGWDDPAGISRRALAVALSDLAAMGAEAGQVLVALGTTPDREAEFWFSLADSMVEATGEFGVDLAGGDAEVNAGLLQLPSGAETGDSSANDDDISC